MKSTSTFALPIPKLRAGFFGLIAAYWFPFAAHGAENACQEHGRQHHDGTPAEQRQAMAREVADYQKLVEEALSMRAAAIDVLGRMEEKQARGATLSGKDLKLINEGAAAMLSQREGLFRASLAHECWLDDPLPTDAEARALQAKGIAMSLSAALVLYDNYLSAISLYRADSKLRRHLNREDRGFAIRAGELNKVAASFASANNRARVRRGILWFEANGAPQPGVADDDYRYLGELIEQSPSRQMVRQVRPLEYMGNMLGLFSTMGIDSLRGLEKEGVQVSSMLFGNTVGLVETRKGKLHGDRAALRQLEARARAGDILLEKTPFRLTDSFIPGHWGHAAVWVGGEDELRQLGIWDHPVVRRHQQAVRAGRGVIEALRSGVVMNTLDHFINVDDLALLRQRELTDTERADIILQALRQVGKGYDFNFDVQSTHRIVCSELVYHSHFNLDWPTERHLGRVTISPDNIAVRAIDDGPLDVVLLYQDGRAVGTDPRLAMKKLVEEEVVRLARR